LTLKQHDRKTPRHRRTARPIIFLTGYPDENARTRAMKAGAIGFLIKPPNHHDLVDHLEKALKQS
jgi:FixJ family two-component response regulator